MTIRRLTLPGLETASYPFSHVVTDGTYAFVSRELDAVYASFFPDGSVPARTCTEAGRLADGASLEITVMARL